MKRALLLAGIVLLAAVMVATGYLLLTSAVRTEGEPTALALPAEPGDRLERVVILHTNDFHGAIEPEEKGGGAESGGLVNLVSLIDQVRAEDPEHTLLLDAGDTFQGTYVSNSTQGHVVMAAMNLAGYDAWALGNHEFDWGQGPLRARIEQADFPALAANLQDAETGKIWDEVEPYAILPAGRVRVAVLGLTYPDTPAINRPENVAGLEFRRAEETVRQYLPELEEQADLIVVLSHLGVDGDRSLARAVDGIDVIVGGHTHTYVNRPVEVSGTLIAQAGAKGQVLGKLDLMVDLETGEIVEHAGGQALLAVSRASEVSADVEVLVSAALADAAETMDQPIGEMARTVEPSRAGEFALGNLVVDAMLGAEIDGRQADIAMHNNGGIRDGLGRGPVSFGQIYAVLPFDNQLMAMDLTGAQVLRILEHSVADRPGAMQVAGMGFRFDMGWPAGSRIVAATVGGKPLDTEQVYRLVTIDYLASGGDGQETFLEGENAAYGDTEVWVVAEYIREHSPVDPEVEGRIEGR